VGLDSTPLEAADMFIRTVEAYVAVGVRDFMFNWPEHGRLNAVREIAAEVLPRLRDQFAIP
jgi:hypothetical protein